MPRCRAVLALVTIVVLGLGAIASPIALAAQKVKPYTQMCGMPGNPCIPKVFWAIQSYTVPASVPPETGPYTYNLRVHNNGGAGGWYSVSCITNAQIPCQQPNHTYFYLAQNAESLLTVGFRTLGLGTFIQKYAIIASLTGDVANDSSASQTLAINVVGTPIAVHITPVDSGEYWTTDSLVATITHPSGVDTHNTTTYVDGVPITESFSSITTTGAVVRARSSAVGSGHTWLTYACALNGRCDSVATHFNSEAISVFSLDDSLPPAATTGGFGGVGPLPLPPVNLRGCPVTAGAPDIVAYQPQTTISGQGNGTAFVASYLVSNAMIDISVTTIDHPAGDPHVCSDPAYYGYIPPQGFNYGWWGTDFHPSLFHTYPYDDDSLLAFDNSNAAPLNLAFDDRIVAHSPGPFSPDESAGVKWSLVRSFSLATAKNIRHASRSSPRTARATSGAFLPNPGDIDTTSYSITVNGTLIVSGGKVTTAGAQAGVQEISMMLLGSHFSIPANAAIINQFSGDTLHPGSNGGWNEIIVSIADTGGHRSSQRTRFVQASPAAELVQGVVLGQRRSFEHLNTGDCAAFGVFQCGGLFIAKAMPGFVTRDRDRGLHLVYRSASQRAPTIVPFDMGVSGYQAAPDSFWVKAKVGAAYTPIIFRYAGTQGMPTSSINAVPLLPNVTAHRTLGVEVPDQGPGDLHVNPLQIEVSSFYPAGGGTHVDSLMQPLAQLYLTAPQTTRFGAGWQLAELGRIMFGMAWPGDSTSAVLVGGDGSYAVYHSATPTNTPVKTWTAPAGATAHLKQLATGVTDSGATYIVYRDDGTQSGYHADGRQLWFRDLTGRQSTYTYVSTDPTKLLYLTDPTGARYQFDYDRSDSTALVSRIRIRAANLVDTSTAATFTYDTHRHLHLMILWKGAGQADTTTFGYLTSAPGAYLDTIVDPRSKATNLIRTIVSYDPYLFEPQQVTAPTMASGYAPVTPFRDEWRRAVPRYGYGRDSLLSGIVVHVDAQLERLITPDQLRGTFVNSMGHPTDFRTDQFGGPTFVEQFSDGSMVGGGGFYVPGSAADDIRDISRDSAGRVTKIVRGREELIGQADSVMYHYNPVFQRVDTVTRTTLEWFPGSTRTLDTLSFAFDSVSLDSVRGHRCYRLTVSRDAFKVPTTYSYPATGNQRCVVDSIAAPGGEITRFTYGSFSLTDPADTRPTSITDPSNLTTSFAYDGTSGNTRVAQGLGEVTTMFFGTFGRADSLKDSAGTATRFVYDRFGRVLDQKTGAGSLAPTTRTTYLPGGLVDHVDVFAGLGEDFTTPAHSDSVETTQYYYNRLGMVDSLIGPGPRTPVKLARKQTFLREPGGSPYIEYPGNGNLLYRSYDWAGRLAFLEEPATDTHRTLDGEAFAADSTITKYAAGFLTTGPYLHGGQWNTYTYDGKGNLQAAMAIDIWRYDTLATTFRYYTPAGQLYQETQTFSGKLSTTRKYQYNRRGQRTAIIDDVLGIHGGSVGGDTTGTTRYVFDSLTARLLSDTSTTDSAGHIFPWVADTYYYDKGGRDSLRVMRLGTPTGLGVTLTTRTLYDAATGRRVLLETDGAEEPSYTFSAPTFDAAGRLTGYSGSIPHLGSVNESFTYDATGLGRLIQTSRTFSGTSRTNVYSYDVFGNRLTDLHESTVYGDSATCPAANVLAYGGDNRLLRSSCAVFGRTIATYYNDQTGNRLMELDSVIGTPLQTYSGFRLTYTAQNQLYYNLNPTASPGSYDANWHLYDYAGRRVQTLDQASSTWFPTPNFTSGNITYYVYDGNDVALTAFKAGTNSFLVRQRYLSEGTDGAIAARVRNASSGAMESLALISDYQGTTVEAIQSNGYEETNSQLYSRDAFGKLETTGPSGSVDVGTGFAGGSTPSSAGGFTYFRNRWYDPSTGRFLSQDPIGLGGGVNLYAYAGNNPTTFSDPFGLCVEDACITEAAGIGLYALGAGIAAAIVSIHHGRQLAGALNDGAEKVGSILTGIWASVRNKVVDRQLEGQVNNIMDHIGKLTDSGTPGGDDPNNRNKWKGDIQKAFRIMRDKLGKTTGKFRDGWEQRIDQLQKTVNTIK